MRNKKKIIDGVIHVFIPTTFEFTPMPKKEDNPNRVYKMVDGQKVMIVETLNGLKVRYLQYAEPIEELRRNIN